MGLRRTSQVLDAGLRCTRFTKSEGARVGLAIEIAPFVFRNYLRIARCTDIRVEIKVFILRPVFAVHAKT